VSAAKADVIRQFGEWTNHNLRLAEGVYTIAAEPTASEPKLRRVTQIATDWLGEDLTGMRVLDLACLEGMYGLELALRGAHLVGIEAREPSLAKARFAQEALGIENAEFHRDDVRNLSPENGQPRSRHLRRREAIARDLAGLGSEPRPGLARLA
jgi:tRNA/tmRNA/rRNA uracil-C5-methylase (TrmA/RlmC/RlmD family)